jgi:hypothetical protein
MNALREQKSTARIAERGTPAARVPRELPKPPVALSTYQPVEVEAEYGCVDWYQYQVNVDEKETRH